MALRTPRPDSPLPWRHALAAALLALAAMTVMVGAHPPAGPPESDARFYSRLALGVTDFGVYGEYRGASQTPTPAMEVLPLYPLLVAALVRVDDGLGDSLRCALGSRDASRCARDYGLLVRVQTALLAAAAWLVWLTAWTWTRRVDVAWLALLAAGVAGVLPEFASAALTENLSLPLGGLLMLGLAGLLRGVRVARAVPMLGVALGLLALTRPSYWYLLLAVAAVAALLCAVPRWRPRGLPLALAAALGLALVSPWLARNWLVFDTPAISAGPYGGRTLIQRVTYNDMRVDEFAAAFIYWLPDFGDSLARALLPATSYRRLGWEDDSFYRESVRRVHRALRAGPGATDLGRLLREDVLGRPLAHARATLALAWRGMFIGKSWGLVAWLCALVVGLRAWRAGSRSLALLFAPALFLCLFQAAVSVSIPRYNLLLLTPLALVMALQLAQGLERWRAGRAGPGR